jgi:purine nucleosidase
VKLICDLDTGIDDTLALAYILASIDQKTADGSNVDLIGVTGTFGNVTTAQGVRNDLAVLDFFGHPEVPVYAGRDHALGMRSFEVSPGSAFIHGRNGLGDIDIPDSTRAISDLSAEEFMIQSARQYGHDLVILATGAFTTVASALQKNPQMASYVGKIVMMGAAVTTCGSVNAWTEANVGQDPEAADIIFKSGAPLFVVGRDVTARTRITRQQADTWGAQGTERGKFLSSILDRYLDAYAVNFPALHGSFLPDPLAAAVALDPTLVQTIPLWLRVDLAGPTRGRTIGDPDRLREPNPTTQVSVLCDIPRFMANFMSRMTALAATK